MDDINNLTQRIIGAAMKVHTALGPGLLESAYEVCLAHELTKQNILVETQVLLPVLYDGIKIDAGYRMDMVVDRKVVVELKAVESIKELHKAQVLSYLKLNRMAVGLLINFNVPRLKDGIVQLVNKLQD
ncbi:MAG: GxxExxY protein [Fuerstiella sp.]